MTLNIIKARRSNLEASSLAEADHARDSRRWLEAAKLYAEYLQLRPDDASIWVQYGHALKESGDLAGAEGAYKQSLGLAPEVADTQLQLGHLFKLRRNFSGAIAAYRDALRIDSTFLDARRELEALGISTKTSLPIKREPSRETAIFLDLSDVFFYLRHHSTVFRDSTRSTWHCRSAPRYEFRTTVWYIFPIRNI